MDSALVYTNKPSVSDVISDTFTIFDHHGAITVPFETETDRDAEFEKREYMHLLRDHVCLNLLSELGNMLIELILEFHAWAAARPSHESVNTAEALEKGINAIIQAEKEQGRSSLSLPRSQSFVGRQCCILLSSPAADSLHITSR